MGTRDLHRPLGPACVLFALSLLGLGAGGFGCAGGRAMARARAATREHAAAFDPSLYPSRPELAGEELDLHLTGREIVGGSLGERLLRVRFSFVSYRGYIAEEDVHRSTGTVFFPVDTNGKAHPARVGEAVVTEFPPGSSVSGFPLLPQYGERPALELGIPAAVVDIRGPIVRDLRNFANPADPAGAPFRSEEQFAYAMLRSFQEAGDFHLLYEQRVAEAWLRAMCALDEVLERETGSRGNRFLLAGEGYGALGAVQAAAVDPSARGVVLCGWPLDWADLHFTRWRRWERQARYLPLRENAPSAYGDSQEVLSFLFSSWGRPDPACPACKGTGDLWRAQFDYLSLLRSDRLRNVAAFVLVGDSDPRFPVDLEARASAPPEALAARPSPLGGPGRGGGRKGGGGAVSRGPFSEESHVLPFRDLRYLRGGPSTLAHRDAIESVLAWIQHLAGYRDIPRVWVREGIEEGDLRLDILVREGNATVTGIEVYLVEIEDRRDSDFKWPLHREEQGQVSWRRIDAIYAGHGRNFAGRWKAYFPVSPTRDRAYYVVVRDRVGNLDAAHSLPMRPLWNLGDPAMGRARP